MISQKSRPAHARRLTHFDARGQAHMVDVGGKALTRRLAIASGRIRLSSAAFNAVQRGASAKGDVLGVARIAGIQAAKRTPDLIPLAHPVAITRASVEFELDRGLRSVRVVSTIECRGPTGVEMEALTSCAGALLTIYDMLKAIDRSMTIGEIRLEEKRGGRSGTFRRDTV